MMSAYMLDTNVFNNVLDGKIPVEEFRGLRVLATHVQCDELNETAVKDPTRAVALLNVFNQIEPDVKSTSSAIWDVSKSDQSSWSNEDGILKSMLDRLRELDAATGKKHRDARNPRRDALIAETAIKNKAILISGDQNLRRVVEEFGGRGRA